MIKVEHTKTHNVSYFFKDPDYFGSLQSKEGTKSILVTDAELVLVNPNEDLVNTLTSHGKLATAFKEYSIETGKNHIDVDLWWKRSETKLLGIPILISRTEKIEVGDKALTKDNVVITVDKIDGEGRIHSECFPFITIHPSALRKILALLEHFSPQQLKDIVDGKLKEGKCLVECIQEDPIPMTYKGVDSRGDYLYYCPKCRHGGSYMGTGQVHCYKDECRPTTIKLNPHITIYPIEEKMYTRDEVIKEGNKLADHIQQLIRNTFGCDYLYNELKVKSKEWFEQNVK